MISALVKKKRFLVSVTIQMEILLRWFVPVFVQIIYFNIQIIENLVGEIKPCANLHKESNIKHVILGTIYV